MALVEMPNGEYVDIEDGTPPDVVERIKSQYKASPKKRVAGTAAAPKIDPKLRQRANVYKAMEAADPRMAAMRLISKGALSNFDDEIGGGVAAGLRGTYNAIKEGDLGAFGREYRTEKQARQLVNKEFADDNPVTATIGEIGGSLLSPIGKGAGLLKAGAKGANALRAEKIAELLGRGASRLDKVGPVGSAILTGGNQGALSAIGASEGDIGADTLNGYLFGAGAGGVLGGATMAGVKGLQAVRDRGAKNAKNVAYSKIADLLDISGSSPARAGIELNIANREGGDAMLMDLAPALRAQAGYLKRRPNIKNSAKLEERGMERLEQRRGRFTEQVGELTGKMDEGNDALALIDDIQNMRRSAGQRDYAPDGAMDKKFVWNDRLAEQFGTATPALKDGLRAATVRVQNQRMDPSSIGITFDEAGDIKFSKIPSMRVFDEIKRGFDDAIGDAIKAGAGSKAAALSQELRLLKSNVSESNPEYAKILATQRDLFEQERAVQVGQDALKRMVKEPRVLLKELKALDPDKTLEARVGFVDTLLHLDGGAGNPITVFRNAMKNKNQRKIMEFMFDGKGKLGKLERWIGREVRSARADAMTAAGGQSVTSDIMLQSDQAPEAAKQIFTKGLTGMAYGGTTGLAAGIARALDMLRRGESTEAQNEIARILMSDGTGLVTGVKKAKEAATRRTEKNRKIAENVGKASGAFFGTAIGS